MFPPVFSQINEILPTYQAIITGSWVLADEIAAEAVSTDARAISLVVADAVSKVDEARKAMIFFWHIKKSMFSSSFSSALRWPRSWSSSAASALTCPWPSSGSS